VVPDLTHVLPIVDDTVLHWVLEGQDTPLLLSLITDINFLVIHANHCRLVLGTTDHCREGSFGGIITSQSCLTHSRSVIDDDGCVLGHKFIYYVEKNSSIYRPLLR
jgi:hypothetical protein